VPLRAVVLLLLFFLLIPPPAANVTILFTSLALFLSLYRLVGWPALSQYGFLRRAMVIAMVCSAICALKSTAVTTCALLFVGSYLFYLFDPQLPREQRLIEFAAATLLTFFLLLPWMVSLYGSSRTLLFPVFGKGLQGSAYGTFVLPWNQMTILEAGRAVLVSFTNVPVIAVALLGLLNIYVRRDRILGRASPVPTLGAALFGTLVLTIAMGGSSIPRYVFPFVMAASLVFLGELLGNWSAGAREHFGLSTPVLAAIAIAGFLVGSAWDESRRAYLAFAEGLQSGLRNKMLVRESEAAAYGRMQNAVPAGAVLLERLEKPFLLNFKRNPVLIVDWPGGASPPPGMPSFKGSEALADYLVSKSIRYVAYSYAKEAGFPKKLFGPRLESSDPFARTGARFAFDFQDNLAELGKTRKRAYDDGEIFVLDLGVRTDPRAAEPTRQSRPPPSSGSG
jgi:hypothetical protein